jgi:hypothetical protein
LTAPPKFIWHYAFAIFAEEMSEVVYHFGVKIRNLVKRLRSWI